MLSEPLCLNLSEKGRSVVGIWDGMSLKSVAVQKSLGTFWTLSLKATYLVRTQTAGWKCSPERSAFKTLNSDIYKPHWFKGIKCNLQFIEMSRFSLLLKYRWQEDKHVVASISIGTVPFFKKKKKPKRFCCNAPEPFISSETRGHWHVDFYFEGVSLK